MFTALMLVYKPDLAGHLVGLAVSGVTTEFMKNWPLALTI
jgi:hypothetical protein